MDGYPTSILKFLWPIISFWPKIVWVIIFGVKIYIRKIWNPFRSFFCLILLVKTYRKGCYRNHGILFEEVSSCLKDYRLSIKTQIFSLKGSFDDSQLWVIFMTLFRIKLWILSISFPTVVVSCLILRSSLNCWSIFLTISAREANVTGIFSKIKIFQLENFEIRPKRQSKIFKNLTYSLSAKNENWLVKTILAVL